MTICAMWLSFPLNYLSLNVHQETTPKHEHHSTVIKLQNTCIIIKLTRTNDKRFKLLKYIKYINKLFKKRDKKIGWESTSFCYPHHVLSLNHQFPSSTN